MVAQDTVTNKPAADQNVFGYQEGDREIVSRRREPWRRPARRGGSERPRQTRPLNGGGGVLDVADCLRVKKTHVNIRVYFGEGAQRIGEHREHLESAEHPKTLNVFVYKYNYLRWNIMLLA